MVVHNFHGRDLFDSPEPEQRAEKVEQVHCRKTQCIQIIVYTLVQILGNIGALGTFIYLPKAKNVSLVFFFFLDGETFFQGNF